MINCILSVRSTTRSTIPSEAGVDLCVIPQKWEPGLELRGRLMGPRCRYATTIEVAYPWRQITTHQQGVLTSRALIPEASWWNPLSPHLYEGPVELWRAGVCLDRLTIRHGLRSFSFGSHGLRINGRLTPLQGRRCDELDEALAHEWRCNGVNLLIVPADSSARTWHFADERGFLVLGELTPQTANTTLHQRAGHPSCLGWLVPPDVPFPTEIPLGGLLGSVDDRKAAFSLRENGTKLMVGEVEFGSIR